MKSAADFRALKGKRPISMVSAYTHWEARFLAESPVDCVLVGDSVATVLDGHATTLAATPEIIARHTAAVARGLNGGKFLIADFPMLTARKGISCALDCAALLLRAGAHAVKIEGVDGHETVLSHLVQSGIPVLGHLGLTPQSVHSLGYRVQGKTAESAERLLRQARAVQDAGCFGIVLECVPSALAAEITAQVSIPTIGIGAGNECDGQVLVFHDLLGLNPGFHAKFVRIFADAGAAVSEGLKAFHEASVSRSFPNGREEY